MGRMESLSSLCDGGMTTSSLLNLSYHNAKAFATGLPTENSVYSQENRNCAGNYAHPTSENGRLAAFASGRPAFQQHAKHAEGSNTPLPRTFRKYCAQSEKTAASPNCKKITQPSGAATPRDSDAHKRIAASQAFCVLRERIPGQAPKAAH